MAIDRQLRLDVAAQLSSDPSIYGADVLIAVKDGVVTPGGHAPTVTDEWAAEQLTKRVAGVRAIAKDICLLA